MTLALLLTAVTGAWADGISVTTEDFGKVICTDGSIYATEGEATAASKTAAAKIFFIDNVNKKGLALALADESGAMDWSTAKTTAAAHTPAVTGGTWKLATMDEWTNMREAAKNYQNDEHKGHSTFKNMANLTQRYWVNTEDEYDSNNAYCYIPYSGGQFGFSTDPKTNNSSCYVRACLEFNIASAAPEVKWDAATKTGTFTMPAFDVEIAPIYAPAAQWAVVETVEQLPAATEGIIAGTNDSIVTPGIVVPGQGQVMYAVTSTNQATAPELSAFSATLPTAKDIADEGADVLVWYYIQGADAPQGEAATLDNTFSDTEPACLTVQVLTNKFDIQLNAANANTIEAGKATVTVDGTDKTVTDGKLQGVKMGSEVKMTAKPGYKFRKVEVKKKEAGKPLANATAEDIGKVVCAAGHLHDAKTAVPDGCTAVGILGKVTETGHGLILSLQDAKLQTWNTINGWTSVTSYASTTLKVLPDDARGTALPSYTALGETTVSNWAVAQKSDYEPIFINLGSTTGNDKGTTYDANVNAYITGIGGREISGLYWSATEEGGNYARYFRSSKWSVENKSESLNVRPVLGF